MLIKKNNHSKKSENIKESKNIRESVVETLSLPKDVCLGALKVALTGNSEAWIENYRGILEYTGCSILLQGKNCKVCIEGRGLTICYYTGEDMKIVGCITGVRYL